MQKLLSEAVAMICGIAMELTDEGCQVISAQCLYGGKSNFSALLPGPPFCGNHL